MASDLVCEKTAASAPAHLVLVQHLYAGDCRSDCARKGFYKSCGAAFRYDGLMRLNGTMKAATALAAFAAGLFAQAKPEKSAVVVACGPLSGQILKCPKFGFVYSIPFGWVDRTAEMAAPPGNDSAQSSNAETLLAVFERPPDAPGQTVNSAVVIAAESLKNYPGVKSAADYFGPVTDLAEKSGFTLVNEPYEFAVGTKKLVRADYSKPRGSLIMFQSTLAMIEKGEIVSFTFVGGSADEVDGLIDALKFGPIRSR